MRGNPVEICQKQKSRDRKTARFVSALEESGGRLLTTLLQSVPLTRPSEQRRYRIAAIRGRMQMRIPLLTGVLAFLRSAGLRML
jgi:hypothetical protein